MLTGSKKQNWFKITSQFYEQKVVTEVYLKAANVLYIAMVLLRPEQFCKQVSLTSTD